MVFFFFFQAEDGIRGLIVTGVQTCALPIFPRREAASAGNRPRPPHSGCERGLFRRTRPFLRCPPAEQIRVASRPSPLPRPRLSVYCVLSDHPCSRPPGNDWTGHSALYTARLTGDAGNPRFGLGRSIDALESREDRYEAGCRRRFRIRLDPWYVGRFNEDATSSIGDGRA